MTLQEFKAWFEGFSEGVGDAPSPEQWAKIKAKVATITGPAYTGIRAADIDDLVKRPRGWRSDEPLIARYRGPGLSDSRVYDGDDQQAMLHAEGRSDAVAA